MKVTAFVDYSHFLFVVAYDLDEVAHDVWEEGYSTEHDGHRSESFIVADRVVITISDCAESSECVIAAHDQLMCLIFSFKLEILDESILLW